MPSSSGFTFLPDEPLIVPAEPGPLLVKLSRVAGALGRHPSLAAANPTALAELTTARAGLLRALEEDDAGALRTALSSAQERLGALYLSLGEAEGAREALGFPASRNHMVPDPINVDSVLATFTMPVRQVLTTIAFDHSAGATAYWLHEIRTLDNHPIDDALLESHAPIFTRVRLGAGPTVFRIESRNRSYSAMSEPFTIVIPAPDD